jgi:alanyl-tRNA synthetase
MTSKELREKYLNFFKERGHTIIPSASLIPENDPSVLFTTAGMHPLVPYLLGEKHPQGSRLTDVQKCIRTGDIDEVGDNTHLTFFEMLGNWSLGDPSEPDGISRAGYWKEDSIKWSFEFLTKELEISIERISVTCFEGDPENNIPKDEESAKIWEEQGIKKDKIKFLGREDNWWGPAGETGPCGPDTEIFVDGVEIWNNVFMQYNKTADGKYEPLKQKNVDTGMGLERTLMILNGQKNVFETDLFAGLLKDDSKESKIVADHIKAAVFILSEGIEPSNTGAGYVLRRLIRRTVRYGKDLDLTNLANKIIEIYKDVYPELLNNKERILENLKQEKEKFEKTLAQGVKEFFKLISSKTADAKNIEGHIIPETLQIPDLNGKDIFIISTTYGFPFEICLEELGGMLTKQYLLASDFDLKKTPLGERLIKEFEEEFKKHQELSRTASAGMFKGGLSDAGEETKKLHTATHLLRRALEEVLGEPIMQKGSNINAERLRFDFGFGRKITDEEKQKIENLVNQKISEKLPVSVEEMTIEKAREIGATGVFDNKYGEKVKVYTIGDFSREICGGPHVSNTSELGKFKITKEEAVSAGIRRIKAILE